MSDFKHGAFYWVKAFDRWTVAEYDSTWNVPLGCFWVAGSDEPFYVQDMNRPGREIGPEIAPREQK